MLKKLKIPRNFRKEPHNRPAQEENQRTTQKTNTRTEPKNNCNKFHKIQIIYTNTKNTKEYGNKNMKKNIIKIVIINVTSGQACTGILGTNIVPDSWEISPDDEDSFQPPLLCSISPSPILVDSGASYACPLKGVCPPFPLPPHAPRHTSTHALHPS
jgi:hypothetical protein